MIAMQAPADPIQADSVLGSLLRNPYDAGSSAERDRFVASELLPGSQTHQAGWLAYWRSLPVFMRDKKSVLALFVGASESASSPEKIIKELAREVTQEKAHGLGSKPGEDVQEAAELTCRSLAVRKALDAIVGITPIMREIRRRAWAAAFGDSLANTRSFAKILRSIPILILGQTGTGKELLGQALGRSAPGLWDRESGKWTPPCFEALNLGSIPKELVADALFGHVQGAHSTARKAQKGVLTRCHEGTVFLDEIAELPLETQVALLRCLQEGKVRPLGAPADVDAAPRLISATNADLSELVDEGTFREDLFHRLSAVVIELPPLRERREDILPIAERLLIDVEPEQRALALEKVKNWSERVKEYTWPGNVRELASVVRLLAIGTEPTHQKTHAARGDRRVPRQLLSGEWKLDQTDQWYARLVRGQCKSVVEAAERLGIHRDTLAKLLKANEH